jgi:very-short-patch-repair endonuclease
MSKKFGYNNALHLLARRLRSKSTLSEVLLWKELKGEKIRGYEFHRQKPVGKYIVDFYCPRLHLAIEIKRKSRFTHQGKDLKRQENIEALEIQMLRFDDMEIRTNMENVVRTIEEWIHNFESKKQMINSPFDNKTIE